MAGGWPFLRARCCPQHSSCSQTLLKESNTQDSPREELERPRTGLSRARLPVFHPTGHSWNISQFPVLSSDSQRALISLGLSWLPRSDTRAPSEERAAQVPQSVPVVLELPKSMSWLWHIPNINPAQGTGLESDRAQADLHFSAHKPFSPWL